MTCSLDYSSADRFGIQSIRSNSPLYRLKKVCVCWKSSRSGKEFQTFQASLHYPFFFFFNLHRTWPRRPAEVVNFKVKKLAGRPEKMYIGNAQKTEVRLNSMPWFHGKIKREEAESLLTPREVGSTNPETWSFDSKTNLVLPLHRTVCFLSEKAPTFPAITPSASATTAKWSITESFTKITS